MATHPSAVSETEHAQPQLALVTMPLAHAFMPSIGLSLLAASIRDLPIRCSIHYETLQFAKLVGWDVAQLVAGGYPTSQDLAGEWIFRESVFGPDRPADEAYLREVIDGNDRHHRKTHAPVPSGFVPLLRRMRAAVPAYLDAAVNRILRGKPRWVGFTTVFQQNLASIAVASRLKARCPDILVIFGGANAEAEMGRALFDAFPCIDFIATGEADQSFPRLMSELSAGRDGRGIPGFLSRCGGDPGPPAVVSRMDDLPVPDYRDFLAQYTAADPPSRFPARLLFESARGCWWGAKQHCTFCGLNGHTMQFRSKSADRVVAELETLQGQGPGLAISVVDNIMDQRYFKDLLPRLATQHRPVELFYEVKANLNRSQVRDLVRAGVTEIQPGIESLLDPVLRLMRKGTTAAQNLQLLKWCAEYQLHPVWNILWGFPGEAPSDYASLAAILPRLAHLPPPLHAGTIRLDRFSPNFQQANTMGFTNVQPYPAYRHLYHSLGERVSDLAYYFAYDYADGRRPERYTQSCAEAVHRWRHDHPRATLLAWSLPNGILITDTRPNRSTAVAWLQGAAAWLLPACDTALSENSLYQRGVEAGWAADELTTHLDTFLAMGYLLKLDDRWLSIVPNADNLQPGLRFARGLHAAVASLTTGEANADGWRIPFDSIPQWGTAPEPTATIPPPPAAAYVTRLNHTHLVVRHRMLIARLSGLTGTPA